MKVIVEYSVETGIDADQLLEVINNSVANGEIPQHLIFHNEQGEKYIHLRIMRYGIPEHDTIYPYG